MSNIWLFVRFTDGKIWVLMRGIGCCLLVVGFGDLHNK